MDVAIAVSQGLGLAAAAGLLAAGPLAVAATAAALGWLAGPLSLADDGLTIVVTWVATAVELVADAIWPGAQAGARLLRRAVGGGLAFELAAGDEVPYVGLVVGALVALAVGIAMRRIRAGAVKAGGDIRGTAIIEDAAGLGASVLALVPVLGVLMAGAGGFLFARMRRREGEKYQGLRVLR